MKAWRPAPCPPCCAASPVRGGGGRWHGALDACCLGRAPRRLLLDMQEGEQRLCALPAWASSSSCTWPLGSSYPRLPTRCTRASLNSRQHLLFVCAAPVHLTVEGQSDEDLLHLLAHDTGAPRFCSICAPCCSGCALQRCIARAPARLAAASLPNPAALLKGRACMCSYHPCVPPSLPAIALLPCRQTRSTAGRQATCWPRS